jgi:hypothetical protein
MILNNNFKASLDRIRERCIMPASSVVLVPSCEDACVRKDMDGYWLFGF